MASNIASTSTPTFSESLIGGTLQGRKQFSFKGASRVCNRRSWKLALEIAALVGVPAIERCLTVGAYGEVKRSALLEERKRVKSEVREQALRGWIRNTGDEDWYVEDLET